jgi:hypothetical protein
MKIRFGFVGLVALALGLGGCAAGAAHTAAPPSSSESSTGLGPSEPAPEPASSPVSGAAPAPAPSPPSAFPQAEAERAPAQRPGLGTEWGETRRSEVHEEPFVRDGGDPFALASVRYDDRAGSKRSSPVAAGSRASRGALRLRVAQSRCPSAASTVARSRVCKRAITRMSSGGQESGTRLSSPTEPAAASKRSPP